MIKQINIVCDGPPGPEGGRFVEVENGHGRSTDAGEWVERDDGLWELRLTHSPETLTDLERAAHFEAGRSMFLVGLGFGVFIGLMLYSMAMAFSSGPAT